MKNTLIIWGCALLALAGCRDKEIYCVDIGKSLKAWTVYDPNDSIVMKDQLGNISVLNLSHYDNKSPYYMTEKGGLMKKKAACVASLQISSETNFFSLNVRGTSSQSGTTRYPDDYDIVLNIGGGLAAFRVKTENGNEGIYPQDIPGTSLESNYTTIGGTVYPEAIVFNVDTTGNSLNVYNFVYVKEQGLVEYSTRQPERTWKLQ